MANGHTGTTKLSLDERLYTIRSNPYFGPLVIGGTGAAVALFIRYALNNIVCAVAVLLATAALLVYCAIYRSIASPGRRRPGAHIHPYSERLSSMKSAEIMHDHTRAMLITCLQEKIVPELLSCASVPLGSYLRMHVRDPVVQKYAGEWLVTLANDAILKPDDPAYQAEFAHLAGLPRHEQNHLEILRQLLLLTGE